MELLKRACLAIGIAVLFVVGATSPALAQDQTEFDKLHAECMDEDNARGVAGWIADQTPDAVTDRVESALCMDSVASENPGAAVEEAASNFWDDPVGKFAKAVIEGNTQALEVVMTFWIKMDMGRAILERSAAGVSNIVWWLVIAAFMVNLITLAARMVWTRRQGLSDGLEDMGQLLWNIAFYTVFIPTSIFSVIAASDILSIEILERWGTTESSTFLEGTALGDSVAGPVLMLAIGGLAFLGSVTQLFAMVARLLILPILIGLLPMLVGVSATDWGRSALQSAKNWLVALVLLKPIAAIVYCVALWIHDSGGETDDLMWTIVRALVIAIAGFSVLGVAKIIVPMLSSMGGENSSAVGGAATAATGAVAGAMGAATGAALGGAGKMATGASSRLGGSSGSEVGGGGGSGGAASGAGRSGGGGPSGGGGSGGAFATPGEGAGASGSGSSGSGSSGNARSTSGGSGTEAATPASHSADTTPGNGSGRGSGRGQAAAAAAARGAAGVARGTGSALTATAAGAKIAGRVSKSASHSAQRGLNHSGGVINSSLGTSGQIPR